MPNDNLKSRASLALRRLKKLFPEYRRKTGDSTRNPRALRELIANELEGSYDPRELDPCSTGRMKNAIHYYLKMIDKR